MSIELHIERLVIDAAVLGGERAVDVRAAIERELARQLTQPDAADALRRLGAVERLALPLANVHKPRQPLGARIAAAAGQGMGIAATAATSSNPSTAR